MNALHGYDSDSSSADEVVASTSQHSLPPKRLRGTNSSPDSEDEQVDPADAFGLKSVAGPSRTSEPGAGPSQASSVATARSESAPTGEKSTALVRPAPDVPFSDPDADGSLLTRSGDTQMLVNIPYSDMSRPVVGPSNPYSTRKLGSQQNSISGHYEGTMISDFDFKTQQRAFDTLGYAKNPSVYTNGVAADGGEYIGDISRAGRNGNGSTTIIDLRGAGPSTHKVKKERKKQRIGQSGDLSVVEGDGAYVGPWGGWQGEKTHLEEGVGPTEEEIQRAEDFSKSRKKERQQMDQKRVEEDERGTEKSVFHGKSMYDYQGRTYLHVPGDVDTNLHGEAGSQDCFLPKTCIHTWTGHTKGVSAVRLFPGSGHLLLSASNDTKVKLWDVYHEGNCLRTFMGHSKGVRDVQFSNDGRKFLSAGYDRQMKLWDTETGQCLQAFSNGKVPFCIQFHPEKQNTFLAGLSDKKVVQYDIDSGEITQEYDQHLGAVNTITFVDDNRRFVTTSDDKTMRAWDFDIPVVIKYVADPMMHSMPAVTVHPNKKWLACQSLDSSVLVYSTDSLRANRKKIFKGHTVSGYACQPFFSPDGRFLGSGDGEGNVVFWDWKTGRMLKRLKGAHKEAVLSCAWLPHETSKLVTAGWDGVIKLWD